MEQREKCDRSASERWSKAEETRDASEGCEDEKREMRGRVFVAARTEGGEEDRQAVAPQGFRRRHRQRHAQADLPRHGHMA